VGTKEVRLLPAVDKRVETGAIQFGDDWPGLFLRGDAAMPLMLSIKAAFHLIGEQRPSTLANLSQLKRLERLIEDHVLCYTEPQP
jgi:hypothetical protein